MSRPTHRYANVQISVVTTPFDLKCIYHYYLLQFFTIVNYIYYAITRINGFLSNNKLMNLYSFNSVVL